MLVSDAMPWSSSPSAVNPDRSVYMSLSWCRMRFSLSEQQVLFFEKKLRADANIVCKSFSNAVGACECEKPVSAWCVCVLCVCVCVYVCVSMCVCLCVCL
jgi:hypothetical protein